MMGLGTKNRDFKTGERSAMARLEIHKERMGEIILGGEEEIQASSIAYNEILSGTLNERIKDRIKELKNKQNRTA